MYIAYIDESGDDGYPAYSSPFFVLSAIYFDQIYWKANYNKILQFRKKLKDDFNFPIRQEFHTKDFIQNKNPYHGRYNDRNRKTIMERYFDMVATLNLKIINTAINKERISTKVFNVLETGFTFLIQRIENDMKFSFIRKNFLIITDFGRISKMTKVTRKIQQINYVPSHYTYSQYRNEIQYLIEEPLPKDSKNSYFIQIADMLSYIVNLYVQRKYSSPIKYWPRRVLRVLSHGDEINLLERIKPVLNRKACKYDTYGIKCYP